MFPLSILYAIVETRATRCIRTYLHVCFYFVANGRLAQLAGAPPLHGGCRGFESLIAHFLFDLIRLFRFSYLDSLIWVRLFCTYSFCICIFCTTAWQFICTTARTYRFQRFISFINRTNSNNSQTLWNMTNYFVAIIFRS